MAIVFETSLQLKLQNIGLLLYLMTGLATINFYNYPYLNSFLINDNNPRNVWYHNNHKKMNIYLWLSMAILLFCFTWILVNYIPEIKKINLSTLSVASLFPLMGIMYYKPTIIVKKPLRQIGWLKPFVIGFVWAGMANVYPMLYSNRFHLDRIEIHFMHILLFFKAFIFVSILAILFDVKDYVADGKSNINTFIVTFGLKKTLFRIVIPLASLGLITFIIYALFLEFSLLKIVLLMMPFILLLIVPRVFRKRRPLLYYLIVIDGLLIAKAFFGSIAVLV